MLIEVINMKRKKTVPGQLIDKVYGTDYSEIKDYVNEDTIDLPDKDGRSLLFHAVLAKNLDLLHWFIEKHADVNKHDSLGWTALHYAAQEYLIDFVDVLIINGADVNAQDEYGNSVLWRAVFASKGRGAVIERLLQAGADVNLENSRGISPIKLANTIANFDVKQFFNV